MAGNQGGRRWGGVGAQRVRGEGRMARACASKHVCVRTVCEYVVSVRVHECMSASRVCVCVRMRVRECVSACMWVCMWVCVRGSRPSGLRAGCGGGAARPAATREGAVLGGRERAAVACLRVHLELLEQGEPGQRLRWQEDERKPRSGLVHHIIHDERDAVGDEADTADGDRQHELVLGAALAFHLVGDDPQVGHAADEEDSQQARNAHEDGLVHNAQRLRPAVRLRAGDDGARPALHRYVGCAIGRLEQHYYHHQQGDQQQGDQDEGHPHEHATPDAFTEVPQQQVQQQHDHDDVRVHVEEGGKLHNDDLNDRLVRHVKHLRGQQHEVNHAQRGGRQDEDVHDLVVQVRAPPQAERLLDQRDGHDDAKHHSHDDEDDEFVRLQARPVGLVLVIVQPRDGRQHAAAQHVKGLENAADGLALLLKRNAKRHKEIVVCGRLRGKVQRGVVHAHDRNGVFQEKANMHIRDLTHILAACDFDGIPDERADDRVVAVAHRLQRDVLRHGAERRAQAGRLRVAKLGRVQQRNLEVNAVSALHGRLFKTQNERGRDNAIGDGRAHCGGRQGHRRGR
mmetsp:Transcript_11528/g.29068  ORF Transcript_11528/g.29068 Transcript_11528/m.29068 type:complete len:569 (+) Transcript_11528:409-2115(+)